MSDDIEARAAEAVAHGLLKAALADDRSARLRVTTGSMHPAIRAGDEILLKACAWTDLRPGDVVVCERDGILQVHRFLRIKVVDGGPRLVTKGDAAWHFDSPLPVDRLIGRAERIERDGQGIDLMGGWPRARARWIAAASAMKAYGAQVFRQLKHRAALAVVLSLALSLHYLTSASAAVSVSSFDAQGGQGQITLNWITATELKNFGFNVERSVNSADPNAWTKIAFVQSQSPCIQSLEPLTYTYTDGGLPAGAKYYYRLQLFGSPCGDPNVYHDTIVSAVASGAVATATPTATAVPPTATPSPTATATPTPTVTPPATSTTSPSAPNATGVPATNTPASVPPGGPGATVSAPSAPVPSASARAAPAVTIAAAPSSGAAAGTPVPPDAPATVEPTTTVVAMAIATTAPNAPRTNPQAPRKPTPTEPAVAASPSPTLLGVGLLAVLGMGMAGFGLLAVAGFVLWQYYLHR